MDCSGSDLLETFHNLGINTGNVSKLTIDSWFDTDCEDTKKLLQWLCCSLGKENVLTAYENDEYEQLSESKSLLYGKQYEVAIEQLQMEYPGILEHSRNLSEVDSMEEELEMFLEEERHLEQQLLLNGNLNKKLSQELKKANEEEIISTMKKKEAEKKCIELGSRLDEAHEKLQSQISRYADHLNEFEHTTRPTFISNVPSVSYTQYYMDIISYLNAFLRREYEMLPKPDATVTKLQNNTIVSLTSNQQEILRRRLFKSMQNYILKQLKEEMLQAELNFLQEIDLNEVISSGCLNDRASILLEANIFSKEELLYCVCTDMENVIKKICDGHVDTPQINIIENNINIKQKKLEILTQLDNKVAEVLAKHILLFLFIEREKTDVQSTDKFFRDVHCYITHNLQNCQQRTESMIKVINDYRIYKNLPLEQRFKIIDILKALVTTDHSCDTTVVNVLRNFKRECSKLEHQVFFTDYEESRQHLQKIEQEIEVMWKFLCNGPTNRIITIPKQLSDCFNKIDELLQIQESSLKSSLQILGDSEKKLSNKWFQIKRQLWIWFLFNPEKVLRAIDQVEVAVKQKRTEVQ